MAILALTAIKELVEDIVRLHFSFFPANLVNGLKTGMFLPPPQLFLETPPARWENESKSGSCVDGGEDL